MQFTCTILPSVARSAPQIFPHYLIKGKFSEKKNKMYFEFLYKFSLKHFSLYEVLSEIK